MLKLFFWGGDHCDIKERKVEIKEVLLFWIFIFTIWLIMLLASYPGIYGYDCIYQLKWYISGNINLHHPIIHTVLMGFCIEKIGNVFGSKELGFFAYCIIQMIVLSAAMTYVYVFMKNNKIKKWIRLVYLLMCAFVPTNAIMSFSGTKDILFSAFFLFSVVKLVYIIQQPLIVKNKRFLVGFVFSVALNILFRNQAVFVWGLVFIIGILILKNIRKMWILVFFIIFILYTGVNAFLNNKFNAYRLDSHIQEYLSVPCLQLGKALYYNYDVLSIQDKDEILRFVPESANNHRSAIADSYKGSFNYTLFSEDPIAFFKLYVRVGFKTPYTYFDSWGRLTIGLWYTDMNYRDEEAYHPYWEYNMTQIDDDRFVLLNRKVPQYLKSLNSFLEKMTYDNNYQKIPIISLLFSGAFYVWIVLWFIAWCIINNKYNYLLAASLPFLYWLTLFLGPVVLYRYLYPIIISTPVFICIMFVEKKE